MLARFLAGLLALASVEAVDRSKFRTCKDTGFCRRHRSATEPKFTVLKESVVSHGTAGVTALLQGEQLESPPLKLTLKFYGSGVCRLQVGFYWLRVRSARNRCPPSPPYAPITRADPRGEPGDPAVGGAGHRA
jgi:hypothetical protein